MWAAHMCRIVADVVRQKRGTKTDSGKQRLRHITPKRCYQFQQRAVSQLETPHSECKTPLQLLMLSPGFQPNIPVFNESRLFLEKCGRILSFSPDIYIYIYIYIQQDATVHSLFIFGNCPTCFGWYLHPLSRAQTTVSTASGICHTVTATYRYRGRVGTGLNVL
jgi:hypothetical protein